MREMIALRKQRYGKTNLSVGDRFSAHDSHVAVLELSRLAVIAPPEPVKPRYERKVVEPVSVAKEVVEPEDKPKRTYQRKDMTAESSNK